MEDQAAVEPAPVLAGLRVAHFHHKSKRVRREVGPNSALCATAISVLGVGVQVSKLVFELVDSGNISTRS
jgi:hypothetical protein